MTDYVSHTDCRYWDCECARNYIHPKSCRVCVFCKAQPVEQPDSMAVEVRTMERGDAALRHRCDTTESAPGCVQPRSPHGGGPDTSPAHNQTHEHRKEYL